MKWLELTDKRQLDEISRNKNSVIIFKHSTRCHVSKFVKKEFEIESILIPDNTEIYLLNLLEFRSISNEIAQRWNVRHESPQVLVISNGKCVYHASHNHIQVADFVTKL